MEWWDLIDIKHKIRKYTWSNRWVGDHYIVAHLDRFFLHSNWLLNGLDCSSSIKSKGDSDHFPIMVSMEKVENIGPFPFIFNVDWCQDE